MLNVVFGMLVFFAGTFLSGMMQPVYAKAAVVAAAVGVKLRGNRSGKFVTGACKFVSLLLGMVFYVSLMMAPVWLMYKGVDITGLVDWNRFYDAWMNNTAAFVFLYCIIRSIQTDVSEYKLIREAFEDKDSHSASDKKDE